MKRSNISVLILTHNSYTTKAGAVEFVINAYLNQTVKPHQIIVINNGSDAQNTAKLQEFCDGLPDVRIISCNLTIGGARNFGVKFVESRYILFNDDDTIPMQNDCIERLIAYCNQDAIYGYGANRLWSPDLNWVSKNRTALLKITKSGDLTELKKDAIVPAPEIRYKNQNSVKILLKSFIGNFGIIAKTDFYAIGGFPEYPGYSCEDDAFAFLCYLRLGKPVVFDNIELLHISHPLTETAPAEISNNQKLLQKLLSDNGYKAFHISRLLFGGDGVLELL